MLSVLGRVEDGRGSLGHLATLRFPSPVGSKNWNRGKDAQLLHSGDHWQDALDRYFDPLLSG
jgi:hypothetical protein